MTTIIITECKSQWGKYWHFKEKGTGKIFAEVDRTRKSVQGYDGYIIYAGSWPREVARHSKKDMALELAKQSCRDQATGDIEFKKNVITIKEK